MPGNRNFVVVGASAGLGKSFALAAGRQGAKVALIARRQLQLQNIADEISASGGTSLVLPCDLRSTEQIESAFQEIRMTWGSIDVALNAAGVVDPLKAVIDTDAEEFRMALEINVLGLFLCCREELRIARSAENATTLINVSSGAARSAYLNWSAYSSSKAAVDTFTRIAAAENQNRAIRVFAISPGPFESHMQETMRHASDKDFPARAKFVKLHDEGQLPTADQVADATLNLALSDWPELNGMLVELRDEPFRLRCRDRGIEINY